PEDEIYAKWAEITADDMAVADEYLASANLPVADSTAIAAAVNDVERPVPEKDCIDIFMTVDNGEQPLVPTTLKSIDAHASQPYSVVAVRCPGPRASRRTPSSPVQRLGAHPRTCVL